MNEYKGEAVIAELTARLVPPDATYPDCMCEILLTKKHLYVLEDNFDGSYEHHYVLSVSQMESMSTVIDTKPSGKKEKELSPGSYLLTAAVGLIGGLVVVPGKGNKKGGNLLMEITYQDGMGKSIKMHFREMQSEPKAFIKAFEKAKADFYKT